MTAFLDTNVLAYAAEGEGSQRSAPSRAIQEALATRLLDATTSVLVIEELWHLELRRRPELLEGFAAEARALFAALLPVTSETLNLALALDAHPHLGSADRIHVATCHENGIDTIVTADAGFDGVAGLRRVDPLDAGAVARLLA